MNEQLIGIQEAAKILNVKPATLRRWDKTGTFKSVRTPGGHRRYRQSDIEKFMSGEMM